MGKYSKVYRKKHKPWLVYQKSRSRQRGRKVRCTTCKRWKEKHLFFAQKRISKGTTPFQANCKHCDRIRQRSEYTIERRRRKRLKIEYGLTEQDYQQLYIKQEGKCKICYQVKVRLDVDHNHTTGKVRGLLCGHCNKAIGLLHDDPDAARRVIAYLLGGKAT